MGTGCGAATPAQPGAPAQALRAAAGLAGLGVGLGAGLGTGLGACCCQHWQLAGRSSPGARLGAQGPRGAALGMEFPEILPGVIHTLQQTDAAHKWEGKFPGF